MGRQLSLRPPSGGDKEMQQQRSRRCYVHAPRFYVHTASVGPTSGPPLPPRSFPTPSHQDVVCVQPLLAVATVSPSRPPLTPRQGEE